MIAGLARWLLWYAASTAFVWAGMLAGRATMVFDDNVHLDFAQAAFVVALVWIVMFGHDVVMGEVRGA